MRAFLALFALFPVSAIAQTVIPDIESMSVEEIDKLPPEIIKELPFALVMKKASPEADAEVTEEMIEFLLSMPLRDLYYTPYTEDDDEIRRAVSAFQRDIGAEVTGELTMEQFEELNRRIVRKHDSPVYLSLNAHVNRIGDAVFASGTWVIENDQIANPINTAEVKCYKDEETCELIQASLTVPSVDSSDNSYLLNLDTETYKIVSWTDNEVISRPFRTDTCRSSILTINTVSEEVYEITRNNNQEACKVGDLIEFPPLDEPRVLRLVDGWEPTWAFWQERRKSNKDFINSEVVERLNLLLDLKE